MFLASARRLTAMPRIFRIRSASLYGDRWAVEGRSGTRNTVYVRNRAHLALWYLVALVFG